MYVYTLLVILSPLAVLSSPLQRQADDLNDLVDNALNKLREKLVEAGYDNITLPSYNETMEFPGRIKVHLTVRDALLGNLSSIYREGKVEATRDESVNRTVFTVPISMKRLGVNVTVGYRTWLTGTIDKQVSFFLDEILLTIRPSISVSETGECRGNIDQVKLARLAGINFSVGPRLWDRIEGRIIQAVLRTVTPLALWSSQPFIESFFRQYGTYLPNYSEYICQYFLPYQQGAT